jgi:hypothetical protein
MGFLKLSIGIAFSLVAISTFVQQAAPPRQAYIFDKIEKIPLYLNGNVRI